MFCLDKLTAVSNLIENVNQLSEERKLLKYSIAKLGTAVVQKSSLHNHTDENFES